MWDWIKDKARKARDKIKEKLKEKLKEAAEEGMPDVASA